MRQFRHVDQILEKYSNDSSRLIAILQEVQEQYRYLPEPVLSYLATCLGLPRARVFGVATFYAHFSLMPKGKHVIRVCDGTACHVNHSQHILDRLYERLKVNDKKNTTEDMMFTVEKVACLGACGLAPVVVIDERVYGSVDVELLDRLLDDMIREEEQSSEQA